MPEISKIERKGVTYDIKDRVARQLVGQKYNKPSDGIPIDDLSDDIKTLLRKVEDVTEFTETDPTVPSWAKANTKPDYTADEVGALPSDTFIPEKISDLPNDKGYTSNIGTLTGVIMNGINRGTSGTIDLGSVITSHQDLSGKQDVLVNGTNIKSINGQSVLGSGDINTMDAMVDEDNEILILY